MGDLKTDQRDLDKLVDDLSTMTKRGLPFAVRKSLNDTAFLGRKLWLREMRDTFVIRNKFTFRSVRVVKVRGGLNAKTMESELGSVADYMHLQEFGGTVRGSGRSHPIPTSVAAGQAKGARPRTKAVRRPNRQPRIRIRNIVRKGSKKQRNAAAIRQAVSTKKKFAILELRNARKGIVKVTGRKNLTIRLIWDLSRPAVSVKPHPTLGPTVEKLNPLLPAIYRRALISQLRFNKVLGY